MPAWFAAALAQPSERRRVTVAGASIAYRAWGEAGGPGVVLVHGGAAHAGWWDHIAPLLVEGRRRVVAADLSGHGDSGRRLAYALETWADELLAVAEDAGAARATVLVGHSMGGMVALRAGAMHAARVGGLVVVDTPIRDVGAAERAEWDRRSLAVPRHYPSREAAVARFRPLPDQGRPMLGYVVAHVARESVTADGDGWTWKYDPRTYQRRQLAPGDVAPIACPAAVLRAEHGRLTAEQARELCRRMGPPVREVILPDAGHHVLLDQPLVLVAALRTLLAQWERRRGRR